jgi:hypothetical protein
MQYATVKGHTLDLAMLICNLVPRGVDQGADRELTWELVRYLNLAHLLLLNSVTPMQQPCSPKHATQDEVKPQPIDNDDDDDTADQGRWARVDRLTLDDYIAEGLVTRDEWDVLQGASNIETNRCALGFAPLTVYFWVGCLLRACNEAAPISCFPLMLTRLSELRSAR